MKNSHELKFELINDLKLILQNLDCITKLFEENILNYQSKDSKFIKTTKSLYAETNNLNTKINKMLVLLHNNEIKKAIKHKDDIVIKTYKLNNALILFIEKYKIPELSDIYTSIKDEAIKINNNTLNFENDYTNLILEW